MELSGKQEQGVREPSEDGEPDARPAQSVNGEGKDERDVDEGGDQVEMPREDPAGQSATHRQQQRRPYA